MAEFCENCGAFLSKRNGYEDGMEEYCAACERRDYLSSEIKHLEGRLNLLLNRIDKMGENTRISLTIIKKAQDALGKQQADDFRNADDRMTALEATVEKHELHFMLPMEIRVVALEVEQAKMRSDNPEISIEAIKHSLAKFTRCTSERGERQDDQHDALEARVAKLEGRGGPEANAEGGRSPSIAPSTRQRDSRPAPQPNYPSYLDQPAPQPVPACAHLADEDLCAKGWDGSIRPEKCPTCLRGGG